MTPDIQFYCGPAAYKPKSTKIMYVDGAAGEDFREGIDVELSHWRLNRTDEQYKAGTSTEICFKYLEANPSVDYDLVVNNHLDVDGVLSVFVLAYPTLAQQFRQELIKAAEIGDFWAWGEGKALKIFQMLSLLFEKCEQANVPLQQAYERCFSLVIKILRHVNNNTQAERVLNQQWSKLQQGFIIREQLNDTIISYHVPWSTHQGETQKYLSLAQPNEPISARLGLWPQVRNRLDGEKLQLISIEMEKGTHYELMVPGYLWADTKGLWLPRGFKASPTIHNLTTLDWPELSTLVDHLNEGENGACQWHLFDRLSFPSSHNHRMFPAILTTIDPLNRPTASRLSIDSIKDAFRELG